MFFHGFCVAHQVVQRYNPHGFQVGGVTKPTKRKDRHARLVDVLSSLRRESTEAITESGQAASTQCDCHINSVLSVTRFASRAHASRFGAFVAYRRRINQSTSRKTLRFVMPASAFFARTRSEAARRSSADM